MGLKKEDKIILIAILLLAIISYFIIQSFITLLLFSFLMVYLLNPIHRKVKRRIKSNSITSIIIILFFSILFFLPIIYIILVLSHFNLISSGDLFNNKLVDIINSISLKFGFNLNQITISEITNFINSKINEVTLNLPFFIFQFFVIIFFYFYLSREYNFEILLLERVLGKEKIKILNKKFRNLINSIVIGQISVRGIQSIIASIGFFIIGIPNSIILGILVFFSSFLPLLGTGLVWFPLFIYYLLSEKIKISIFILLLGLFISVIDNILFPILVSSKININPVLILISLLGGIEVFGIYGILLGPFILGSLYLLIDDFFENISKNPRVRKIIWTEEEREKYRKLRSKIAKKEFVKITNLKYEKEIYSNNNLKG